MLEPVHRGFLVGDDPARDFRVHVLGHGQAEVGFDGLSAVDQPFVRGASVPLGHDHGHARGVELRPARSAAHLQQRAPLDLAVLTLALEQNTTSF